MRWFWPWRRRRPSPTVPDSTDIISTTRVCQQLTMLCRKPLMKYRPDKHGQYPMWVGTPNLRLLAEQIEKASYSVKHRHTPQPETQCLKRRDGQLHRCIVDDYLVDDQGYPLTLVDGVSMLLEKMTLYKDRLQAVHAREPHQSAFYERQYSYLLQEVDSVTQRLLELF